jgi:hypothetical protein
MSRDEVARHLRAYWRGEDHGKHGVWSVCPVCRDAENPSLGMGSYGGREIRLTCWNEACGAVDEQVLRALGLLRPERDSREDMLQRVERVIRRLEWDLRDVMEPPRIQVPGERWAA